MSFSLFSWIRNSVRQAVLAGIADAVEQVTTGTVTDGDARLAKLLSAPVDVTPPAVEAEEPTAANGRSRRAKASS